MENGIFYVIKGLEFASDSQKNSRTVFRQLDFRKKIIIRASTDSLGLFLFKLISFILLNEIRGMWTVLYFLILVKPLTNFLRTGL